MNRNLKYCWRNFRPSLKATLLGMTFYLGINHFGMNLKAIAETIPNSFRDQNLVGRWQVKFPTAADNPDIEVAITADGKMFYVDKAKGEAIEILSLRAKVSDQPTIPENIKIIDIQAQAKAEAIARQNRRLQTEAQTVLSTIHNAQSEYFAKNNQFGSKLEDLGFGTEINSQVFNYKIEAIAPKFIVQSIAIFKNMETKNMESKDGESKSTEKNSKSANLAFIGISYLTEAKGESTVASLICQGNQTTQQFVPRARFIKIGNYIKDIKCPVGFTPISK